MSEPLCPFNQRIATELSYRELLLLTGISTHGIGNWKKIAEHVGTRSKEEAEEHYREVYVESKDWPMPVCILLFKICIALKRLDV
jgi:hypothetical protein